MNAYDVKISTGISGYDIDLLIDADSEEEARQKAMTEAREMIETMLRRMRIVKIEEE